MVHTHITCYEYVLKKITALNYMNKHMTLACQFRALLRLGMEQGNNTSTYRPSCKYFTHLLLVIKKV